MCGCGEGKERGSFFIPRSNNFFKNYISNYVSRTKLLGLWHPGYRETTPDSIGIAQVTLNKLKIYILMFALSNDIFQFFIAARPHLICLWCP